MIRMYKSKQQQLDEEEEERYDITGPFINHDVFEGGGYMVSQNYKKSCKGVRKKYIGFKCC